MRKEIRESFRNTSFEAFEVWAVLVGLKKSTWLQWYQYWKREAK